jgi:hypothetical protein
MNTAKINIDLPQFKPRKAVPGYVIYSAWAVPVMVLGQFAMLASVPVALITFGAFRDKGARPLRWWAALMAGLYLVPLALWRLNPDGAPSLSRDMHPVFAGLIVASAVVLLVKIHTARKA